MSIIIDIIVVAILVCSVYRGYKKGIIDVGFKIIAIIVSLLISIILYSPITNLIINNTEIDEKIEEVIIKNGIVDEYSNDIVRETKNSMVEMASKPLAKNIVGLSVIIVLFLSSRIILIILKTFTNVLSKLPVIKQLNEAGGIVYGVLAGLIVIYILLAIIYFITTISGNVTINEMIDKTYITKLLYSVF